MSRQFARVPARLLTGRLASFILILLFLGCVQPMSSEVRPASRALGARYPVFEATTPSSAPGPDPRPGIQQAEGPLTLRKALALALLQNPELAAFSWESRAREADALQAGLLRNPKLSFEAENFAGNGQFDGYDSAETTVMLSQLVQLGGKRGKRRRVAELRRDLADWDYEVKRLDVLTAVVQRFVSVLEAQSRLRLAEELRDLANESLDAVAKRVRVGAASSVEETRAAVNASSASVAHRRAAAKLAAARAGLAALWGAGMANYESAVGELETIYTPPAFDAIRDRLASNPDIARWASELAHRKAVIDLQDARRIPNVTVGGGVRRLEASSDSALVFGVTIPLPIFDRKQGARQAARLRHSKAQSEEFAALTRVMRDLEVAYQSLDVSHDTVMALRKDVLPQAESA